MPQLLCKILYRSDDFGIKFLEGAKSPLIHQFKHDGNNLGTNSQRGLPLCAQFLDDSELRRAIIAHGDSANQRLRRTVASKRSYTDLPETSSRQLPMGSSSD